MEIIVSVILPVYNCQNYVLEAVQSILNQTYKNFELIIIDDCSTDNTHSIIQKIDDSRIQIVRKVKNSGYTDSLNIGINISKGKYIARMDGDDISLPNRFEKQLEILEKNPEIILCGTAIQILNSNTILSHPSIHEEILVKLCFGTSFYHPTVMIRKEVLIANNYNSKFEPAEDYELWTRLAFLGKFHNINEVLLNYRVHTNQISFTKNELQASNSFSCKLTMLNHLGVLAKFSREELSVALETKDQYLIQECKKTLIIFDYLIDQNNSMKIYDQKLFKEKVLNLKISFLKRFLEKDKKNLFVNILFLIKIIKFSELQKVLVISKRIKLYFLTFKRIE